MVLSKDQMKTWMQELGWPWCCRVPPVLCPQVSLRVVFVAVQHRNWAPAHPVALDGKVGPVPAVTPGSGSASELATAGDVSQFHSWQPEVLT